MKRRGKKMKRLKFYGAMAIGLLWLIFFALFLVTDKARAQDQDHRWVYRTIWKQQWVCDIWGSCYLRRWRETVRYQNHAYRLPPVRVYGYTRRERDDGGERCKALRRAVGQQHLTVDGAKKEANDAWAGTVRFHHGEKYLDLSNAREVTYTCSRSSIKEGGVTTLGQTLTRCEIEAVPCRPRPQKEDGQ